MRFPPAAVLLISLLACSLAQGQASDEEEGKEAEAHMQKIMNRVVTHGEVCPDPDRPCQDFARFRAHELSFKLEQEFKFDRARDRSRPFYAVLLKSAELCSIPEEERMAAQAMFPRRKVFVHRLHCDGFADKLTYTNVNAKAGFIAVFAGRTEAQAKEFLEEVRATGKFAGANIRRMHAVIIYQLE